MCLFSLLFVTSRVATMVAQKAQGIHVSAVIPIRNTAIYSEF